MRKFLFGASLPLAVALFTFLIPAPAAQASCANATYAFGPYECTQGGWGDCTPSNPDVDTNDPGINQFSSISASPTSIYQGEGTTLSWAYDVGSNNTNSCFYNGDPGSPYPIGKCTITGLGQVGNMDGYYYGPSQGSGAYGLYDSGGSGNAWVTPAQTTTYTISCSGYSLDWGYDQNNGFSNVRWFYTSNVSQHSVTITVNAPPSCQSSANSCGQVNYGVVQYGSCSASTPANPSYYGQSCAAGNACGTNYGTYNCSAQCSASAPSLPGNYGQSCSATSAANACGQTAISSGTYQCNGTCSASTPSVPANPANYGQSCALTSSANACGQTQTQSTGTYNCSAQCVGTPPAPPANPAGYGSSCSSAANACGQTNAGTISCNGSCSASAPANPATLGQSCTSAANSCGQTNAGTISCSGSCSASAPANPANLGQSCTSAANACGMTQSNGTYQCSGSCSSTPPSDSLCNQPPNTPTFSYLYDDANGAYVGSSADAYHSSGYRVYLNATDPNNDNVAIYYQLYDEQSGQVYSAGWSNPTWNGSGGWDYVDSFANFAAGHYDIRAYSYDPGGLTSSWSNWQPITLNTPSLSVSCSGAPATLYQGQSASWTASASGGNGSYSYSWSGTDGLSGAGSSVSKEYDSAGSKTASVHITSAGLSGDASCTVASQPGGITVTSCQPTLTASPDTVNLGQGSDLQWSIPPACASSCLFSDGHSGGTSGTYHVTPPQPASGTTDTYAVTCGGRTAQASITVRTPSASLSASPTRVASGGQSTITWNASNVDSCVLTKNGSTWQTTTAGAQTDTVNALTNYLLTCASGSSHVTAQATVEVAPNFQEF